MAGTRRAFHRRAFGAVLAIALAAPLLAPRPALAADGPQNDLMSAAIQIDGVTTPGFSATETADMTGASYPDPGEPNGCARAAARTVWYRFVATMSGSVTITTAGSDAIGAAVTAYQWRTSSSTYATLSCGAGTSITFSVLASGTYWIQGSDAGSGTTLVLNLSFSSVPPNDRFTSARGMTTVWTTDLVDTTWASSDVGESDPAGCASSGRTVWYRFSPTVDGAITVDPAISAASGSTLAGYLQAGSTLSSLVPLSCSYGPLVFNVLAGRTYYIRASDRWLPGELGITWSLGPAVDVAPPMFVGTPADVTVSTSGSDPISVTYAPPTAIDDSGVVHVSCSPASGSAFPVGPTWVTCTARDDSGNVATTKFQVLVERKLTVPAGVRISSYDVTSTPASGWYGWHHRYDGAMTASGGGVQAGWSWTPLADYFGGSGTLNDGYSTGTADSQLFTTNTEASSGVRIRPTITLHLEGVWNVSSISIYGGETSELEAGALHALTVEIGSSTARIDTTAFGATNDRIDLSATALAAIPTSTIVLRDFEGMLPWGNEYNTFAVSEVVVDGTPADAEPPELTLPSDIALEAAAASGAVATFTVSALDVLDGPVAATCDRESGSVFPIGPTTVTCTAEDAAGNRATGSFTVTIRDTTAPVVAFGTHRAMYTVADAVHIGCEAVDAVGVVETTCRDLDAFGWSFGLGTITRSATGVDAAGNIGSASTSFVVVATYSSMKDLTSQWVKKAGIAKDLAAILDAAATAEAKGQLQAEAGKLADYRALVLAQSGKSIIPAGNAAMLVSFSFGL